MEEKLSILPISIGDDLYKAFPIGRVCLTKKTSAIFLENSYGIVVNHYSLGNKVGVGIFFPGEENYDGFSLNDLNLFIENSNLIIDSLKNYKFKNVASLNEILNNNTYLIKRDFLNCIKKKESTFLAQKIDKALINGKKNKKNKI